jgi:hypothetical protein
MLAAAQYYMIVQAQPHRGDRLRHLAGHRDVALRRRAVASGMVVHHRVL